MVYDTSRDKVGTGSTSSKGVEAGSSHGSEKQRLRAQEQVELLRDHQWNDDNERAPMTDRQHTQRWNEAEQLHLWEFDESEAA